MDEMFDEMDKYFPLATTSKAELGKSLSLKQYKKNELVLGIGEIPQYYYFLRKGLLCYNYIAENGDTVIKKFFAEKSFVASTSAIIQNVPSLFSITALEKSEIIRFPAQKFRGMFASHHDLALFQIKYLEKHWVVAKEGLEISLKYQPAKIRYLQFLAEYPWLIPRIKQHHIASFLGITPTQLSRIRKGLNS